MFVVLNAGRIVLSLYALDNGGDTSDVGLVISLFYVFPLLLSWPAGVLADRHGSRWLFVTGTALGAACMLAPCFWRALPALWIGASGIGIAMGMASVVGQLRP